MENIYSSLLVETAQNQEIKDKGFGQADETVKPGT
jgi:hypothetical protein